MAESQATAVISLCEKCGTAFGRKMFSGDRMESVSTFSRRRFCSRVCANAALRPAIDVTGHQFGSLTALKIADQQTHRGQTAWECRCACGEICVRTYGKLTSGKSKHCGCQRNRDLTGQRFERLVVLGRADGTKALWTCRCDCGTEKVIPTSSLKHGLTRSCGCLAIDLLRERSTKDKDAVATTPEYRSWYAMWSRCTNPKDKSYSYYGGRGITVCDRWKDVRVFIADMGRRPDGRHSIDRIDNNGNYEPSNCRWATREAQAGNRRSVKSFTYAGMTLPLKSWANLAGWFVPGNFYKTVWARIFKQGMSFEDALFTPPFATPPITERNQ